MARYTSLLGISLSASLWAIACGASSDEQLMPAEELLCEPGETQECYGGPMGSQDVGACVGGTQTCSEDGLTWSECQGAVVPILEVCENSIDDDCNGMVDDILDVDGDGYTRCDGDCCETADECDEPAKVNPGSIEVISEDGTESADENCNGMVDEVTPPCDQGILLDDSDPRNAARAIDLCHDADTDGFGVVSAQYVRADGSAFISNAQHGIQAGFGNNAPPRRGGSMLALATGTARTPVQAGACGSETCLNYLSGTAPTGFPQDVPSCPGGTNINDDIALSITLRAPLNAKGYTFDFSFYSFEYPEWVCTEYNDQFIALVEPAPEGAINGNIAFDGMSNPVSVNIAFFDVCPGCPLGTAALDGTGFDVWDDAGATAWLKTQAPIEPGAEFTIQFMIWDTGDAAYDSTVLIDNFQWLADSVSVSTNPID